MSVPPRLLEYLTRNCVEFDILEHAKTYTAQRMAQATHIRARDVAKPVLIRDGDRHRMVILPADCLVDLDRLTETLGLRAPELATEREMTEIFPDCETGAMPIFGNLYGVPVAIDNALTTEDRIAFSAGSHDRAILMKTEDFLRLAQPQVIEVGVHV